MWTIAAAVYFLAVFALAYILVCGGAPCHEGTILDRANDYILNELFETKAFLCFERRVVPWLYGALLFFLGGGTARSASRAHPAFLPELALLLAAGLSLYIYLVLSDPGAITADNYSVASRLYPFDHVLYAPGRVCPTCDWEKPARSKHCRVCDRCVSRFDHHCAWIANCVGARNTAAFVAFLAYNAALCARVACMCAHIVVLAVRRRYPFYSPPPLVRPYVAAVMRTPEARDPFLLGICVALLGAALASFALYHMYLASINTTTNEMDKWSDLRLVLRKAAPAAPATTATPATRTLPPRNLYDRGWLPNIVETLRFDAFARTRAPAPPLLKTD